MCGFLFTSGYDLDYHKSHLIKISQRGQDSTRTTLINQELILSHSLLSISSEYKHIQPYALTHKVFKNQKFKLMGKEVFIEDSAHFVFNGEIFNLDELKFLIEKYYSIKLESIYEEHIILALVLLLDDQAILKKIRGFYSATIIFPTMNLCFLSRDINGLKPLFYSINSNKISISSIFLNDNIYNLNYFSQISGSLYMSYGFIPSPYTLYKNSSKVMPGEQILLSLDKNAIIARNLIKRENSYSYNKISKDQINNSFIKEIKDSLSKRLIHTNDFSVCLSGGLDSSFLASLLSDNLSREKLKSFTIDIKGNKDILFANQVINKLDLNSNIQKFSDSTYAEVFSKVINSMTCPLADTSIFPTFKVLANASNFSRVCITGDGADELMGGYSTYSILYKLNYLKYFLSLSSKLGFSKAIRLYDLYKSPQNFYSSEFESPEVINWKEKHFLDIYNSFQISDSISRKIKSLMLFDSSKMLLVDNFLAKIDICSVNNNIECRNPFLDSKFINFCNSIPLNYLLNMDGGKLPIRNYLKKNFGNKFVQRKKEGFAPKLHSIYRKNIKIENEVLDLLVEIFPDIVKRYLKINKNSFLSPIYKERLIILGCYLNNDILNKFQNEYLNHYA